MTRKTIYERAKAVLSDPEVRVTGVSLAEMIGAKAKSTHTVLKLMHRADKLIYICGWKRSTNGRYMPIYQKRTSAKQKDVPTPKPQTWYEGKDIIPSNRGEVHGAMPYQFDITKRVSLGLWGL